MKAAARSNTSVLKTQLNKPTHPPDLPLSEDTRDKNVTPAEKKHYFKNAQITAAGELDGKIQKIRADIYYKYSHKSKVKGVEVSPGNIKYY